MALKPGLRVRQSQRLSLTPGVRQGVSILQMPTLDLWSELRQQADENPLIELRDTVPAGFDPQALHHLAGQKTMADSLREQVALMGLSPGITLLAQLLTGDLDDSGYLTSTTQELADDLNIEPRDIEAAVAALQGCEPAGIAARSVAECLTLQLIDKGIAPSLAHDACANLDLLMEGRWPAAVHRLNQPPAVLKDLAEMIRGLSPRPAAGFASETVPRIPEVLVESDGQGGFSAIPLNGALPEVSLDHALAAQIAKAPPAMQAQLDRAQHLLRALDYRNRTLLAITEKLLHHQHGFFAKGPDHMAPLTRCTIAQDLELHPSTVGRAITGKALLFDGQALPLSQFFGASLAAGASAYHAQRLIRRMIQQEGAHQTLSDEEIASNMRREGVDIARRTVAKYRKCMNIPSSFDRKRQKAMRASGPSPKGLGSP